MSATNAPSTTFRFGCGRVTVVELCMSVTTMPPSTSKSKGCGSLPEGTRKRKTSVEKTQDLPSGGSLRGSRNLSTAKLEAHAFRRAEFHYKPLPKAATKALS